MLTEDAYSSGQLVPSHLGLAYVQLVETNRFPEIEGWTRSMFKIHGRACSGDYYRSKTHEWGWVSDQTKKYWVGYKRVTYTTPRKRVMCTPLEKCVRTMGEEYI